MAWYEKASDSFDGTANPLASPWVNPYGGANPYVSFQKVSGLARTASTAQGCMVYSGLSLGSNQYSQSTIKYTSTGPCVRSNETTGEVGPSGTTNKWLSSTYSAGYWRCDLYRSAGGASFTQVATANVGATPIDKVYRMEAVGNDYSIYIDGSGTASVGPGTDTSTAGGTAPGIYGYFSTQDLHDNWSAGDENSPGGQPTMSRLRGVPGAALGNRRGW